MEEIIGVKETTKERTNRVANTSLTNLALNTIAKVMVSELGKGNERNTMHDFINSQWLAILLGQFTELEA